MTADATLSATPVPLLGGPFDGRKVRPVLDDNGRLPTRIVVVAIDGAIEPRRAVAIVTEAVSAGDEDPDDYVLVGTAWGDAYVVARLIRSGPLSYSLPTVSSRLTRSGVDRRVGTVGVQETAVARSSHSALRTAAAALFRERHDADLDEWLRGRRRAGASLRAIALELDEKFDGDVRVTHQTVATWLAEARRDPTP